MIARRPATRWFRAGAWLAGGVVLCVGGLAAWNLRPPAVGEPANFPPAAGNDTPAPIRFRVMTWNAWGLRWITPRRAERLSAVAREAAALRPDIVGFQEVWVEDDREEIVSALRRIGLLHARYFPSGLVGSGLLLVSRFPIESDGFIRFERGGNPAALNQGDWWAGKGLSLSVLRLPNGAPLFFANTHLHAGYRNEPLARRTQRAQGAQLLPWVRRVRATKNPALWVGDWNKTPDSDVIAPLVEAGAWKLLTPPPTIDNIFGGGDGWQWRVIDQGRATGFLPGKPPVPWSDHAARWVDLELRRSPGDEISR